MPERKHFFAGVRPLSNYAFAKKNLFIFEVLVGEGLSLVRERVRLLLPRFEVGRAGLTYYLERIASDH